MSLPQNVITVTTVLPDHIYRPHSTTVKFSPSPR